MPMPITDIIETCESWILAIEPLDDLEYQKKYWFDYESPMISSFDEAVENFLGI